MDARDMHELITKARALYERDGVTLSMPFQQYDRTAHAVHPSRLGGCDLQVALKAAGVAEDNPCDQNPAQRWLLDHGNYVAPMIQLPLMYYAMCNANVSFRPEVPLLGKIGNVTVNGKADGILEVDGMRYLLEIKNTEGTKKRSVGEPSYRYALQVMAYMLLAGIDRAFIITCAKWGWHTYELRHVYNMVEGFEVYDRFGERYYSYFGDWNNPESINYNVVKDYVKELNLLIAHTQAAMKDETGRVLDAIVQELKIEDPLNNSREGWMCMKTLQDPTKKLAGKVRPNCPFAGRCHHMAGASYQTRKDEDGKIVLDLELE